VEQSLSVFAAIDPDDRLFVCEVMAMLVGIQGLSLVWLNLSASGAIHVLENESSDVIILVGSADSLDNEVQVDSLQSLLDLTLRHKKRRSKAV